MNRSRKARSRASGAPRRAFFRPQVLQLEELLYPGDTLGWLTAGSLLAQGLPFLSAAEMAVVNDRPPLPGAGLPSDTSPQEAAPSLLGLVPFIEAPRESRSGARDNRTPTGGTEQPAGTAGEDQGADALAGAAGLGDRPAGSAASGAAQGAAPSSGAAGDSGAGGTAAAGPGLASDAGSGALSAAAGGATLPGQATLEATAARRSGPPTGALPQANSAAALPSAPAAPAAVGPTPGHVFAQFEGVLNAAGDSQQISFAVTPDDFTLAGDKTVLGFQLHAGSGSLLDPATIEIRQSDGTLVTPRFSNADLAGGTQSLALAELSFGTYLLSASGERGTTGAFQLDVFLVGDADGSRQVNLADGDLVSSLFGSVAGDGRYRVEADADLDGRITSFDYALWRENLGDSTRLNPVSGLVLAEGNNLVVQAAVPVALGQPEGTRTLRFELTTQFDTTDPSAAVEDLFLVYLVDPADPSRTLLDRGRPGTALFSLAGGAAEFAPGLVRYDGLGVEIDVSSLAEQTSGLLVFQLINSDADNGSVVQVGPVSNVVDPEGVPGPVFPVRADLAPAGPALDLAGLNPSEDVRLLVGNVRVDPSTGSYTAEFRVRTNGPASGRQVAVVFPGLPAGVELLNPSGVNDAGAPYLNFRDAIPAGGLAQGATSDPIEVTITDPGLLRFVLVPEVLVGGPNRAPVFSPVGPLTVLPGSRLEVVLEATDPDADPVTFSLRPDGPLPTSVLRANGTLAFAPAPGEVGTYSFTLIASDGALAAEQQVTLTVAADPVTTTRISGVVQDTAGQPLAGVPLELGDLRTVTAADGSFLLEAAGALPDDTLKIRGEALGGPLAYPFVAEKLDLLLGHAVYEGVNNVVSRPIFLPAIDTANAVLIDPAQNITVGTAAILGASVFVAAGTLRDQQGGLYNGPLSITEVPVDLTPAALPDNLFPDLVVTIQPAEMVFATPAPLTLPNRAGYAPGTLMDLWSINPVTGLFDNVGTGRVSADGSVVETASGGIRNSSWHFFAPPAPPTTGTPFNPDERCDECEVQAGFTSDVLLHSGAVRETHDLVSYQSLGATRGLQLVYDSLRADVRPIVHFRYADVPSWVAADPAQQRISGQITVSRGATSLVSPQHFWSIPAGGGNVEAAIQVDLRALPSGEYDYSLLSGFRRGGAGSSSTTQGKILVVNQIDSPFGSGWGLAGLQEVLVNGDGSVLLIDGGGSELLFRAPATPGGPYVSPPGDFSTLERLADGTFRRTLKDQTVYLFNAENKLESVRDRNGNETRYVYFAGRLDRIIDPVGLETVFGYTGDKVTSITDPAGRITQLQYDSAGNLMRVIDPDNSQRTWEYDADHHLTAETNQRGNREETFYDFAGRAVRALRADGTEIRVVPVQVQGLYRALDTASPANAPPALNPNAAEAHFAESNGNVVRAVLDAAGQLVSSSDSNGFLPATQRDGNNLVTQATNGRGQTTLFMYDARGNVTGVRDEVSGSGAAGALFPNPVYATGVLPNSVRTGDLDGDGLLDIITANETGSVSVLLNRGDGTFRARVDYPAAGPTEVALGDLDGDGDLDMAVASPSNNIVTLWFGNGDGTFGGRRELVAGNDSIAVALGDMDGDGDLDVVAGNRTPNTVTTILGNGDGTFGASVTSMVGGGASRIALGDLDRDGDLDVVASPSSGNSIRVLMGNGDGSLGTGQTYTVGSQPNFAVLGDLDRDGDLDIVTANSSSSNVTVLLNGGDGTFGAARNTSVGIGPSSVMLGDLDGDGDLDLVTGNDSNSVTALLNSGDGTFENRRDYSAGTRPIRVALGDLDQDGNLDLVASNYSAAASRVTLLFGSGDGTFAAQATFAVGDGPVSVAVADLNGDGRLDLVTANEISRDMSVLLGAGDGTFALRTNFAAGGAPVSVAVADLNGDGRPDLVTANFNTDTVSVLLGGGDGTFAAAVNFAAGDGPFSVTAADLNGDGQLDLATANRFGDSMAVLLGAGDGTFAAPTNFAVGDEPFHVAVADLNGDGRPDVVTANTSSDNVSVLLGNGDGTFAPRVNFAAGDRSESVAVADLNGDGRLDLVTGNVGSGTVSVLLGAGDGTFAAPAQVAVGGSPAAVAVADLNGDGRVDLATANLSADSVSVLLGAGDGSFAIAAIFAAGQNTFDVAAADLNGDGLLDLITANVNTDNVSVLLGFGGGSQVLSRRFTYDPTFSQLASVTDELGRQTLYDIDPANGNVRSITRVVGLPGGGDDVITGFTYTTQGLVDTVTDPLGRITDNDYDPFGRLFRITYAHGTADEAAQQFEYDPATVAGRAGLATAVIDENGNRTEYRYDDLNRLTRITQPDPDGPGPLTSPVTLFTYDLAGNLETTTDARNNVTRNEYDARDRLTKTIDAALGETLFAYDPAGNLASVTDPLGHTTFNRYDARGRLVATTDPDRGVTTFRYDFDNNLTAVIDPVGNRTNFAYDARSRLIRETDPIGQAIVYAYDPADNLIRKTDRDGRGTTYRYDDLDRLLTETWLGTGPAPANVINYGYDPAGNLLSVSDSNSALTFTYDDRDRVRTADNNGTPGAPRVVLTYGYDGVGNVRSVADTINGQPGATTVYRVDALNRVDQITQTGPGVGDKRVDLGYNELGQFETITRYADLAATQLVARSDYRYDDPLNRLTNLTHSSTAGTVAFYDHLYDAASRITRIADIDGVTDYGYDDRDQLTGADHSAAGNLDESYTYDANRNRVASSRHGTGYQTGPGNRLLSDGTFNYEYDNEGNLTRRIEIATNAVREFAWDHRNRLVSVTDKDAAGTATQVVTFRYDALNRRILKTVDTTPADAVDAVFTHFVNDRDDVLLDFVDADGSGPMPPVQDMRYLDGPAVDQVLAQEDRMGNVLWMLTDHLGTVRDLVTSSGAVANHIVYDSYGNVVEEINPSVDTRYLFTGRERDEEIRLSYHRARFLDPLTGRFFGEDPAGLANGDSNLFVYVRNSPVAFFDPAGREATSPGQPSGPSSPPDPPPSSNPIISFCVCLLLSAILRPGPSAVLIGFGCTALTTVSDNPELGEDIMKGIGTLPKIPDRTKDINDIIDQL